MPQATAIPRRLRRALMAAAMLALAVLPLVPGAIAAGPPFPDPVPDQAVYDEAEVLSAQVEEQAEITIDAIENRTGAEVVVYTQLVPTGVTQEEAEADAIALMDQWGVGRKGIDDGLVILFDLHRTDPCHGQVQLYAGPGFRATFLTNEERQAIFENEMLPYLRSCDLDAALLVAMERVDAAATPEHARTLETARQGNALIGLVLAPLVVLLIVGWALLRWYREGRDPVYLDDPSILMPAPPPGLTPAAGAAIRDGGVGRRALTAASLDLAVRGYAGFRAEPAGILGRSSDLGIFTGEAVSGDPAEQARMERARRRPMDPATEYLRGRLAAVAGGAAYIEPDEITELGQYTPTFNKRLETHLVNERWYRERPTRSSGRWVGRGVLFLFAGIATLIIGFNLPSSGVVLLGIALIGSAIALFVISAAMPARTQAGAVIQAMLEAYRRTLVKTMAQARSMGQVVTESAIPLIESPDDAVAWGVALGLQDDVERVLERSAEDLRAGGSGYYMPAWYMAGAAASGGGGGGEGGGWAPGLMSSSPIPDFGGMMAALGTIGNSPASSGSGSGGGGGFSGGGSGGGGGGAGGGF
ncbi:MAG: TPM domain-containing protein [Candidatus Limnocylindrales bacterium]